MGTATDAKQIQLASEIRRLHRHSQLERVRAYIRNQEAHHTRISFEEEFKALLGRNGIDFEERYLWE
jgi:hypothetical protein